MNITDQLVAPLSERPTDDTMCAPDGGSRTGTRAWGVPPRAEPLWSQWRGHVGGSTGSTHGGGARISRIRGSVLSRLGTSQVLAGGPAPIPVRFHPGGVTRRGAEPLITRRCLIPGRTPMRNEIRRSQWRSKWAG